MNCAFIDVKLVNIQSEETIFSAALERSTPAERAAYLDGACAGQPELRQRVEALLDAQPHVGDFLEEHQANPEAITRRTIPGRPAGLEGLGTRIGRYKLRELYRRGRLRSFTWPTRRSRCAAGLLSK
jgi:hypothetical protein